MSDAPKETVNHPPHYNAHPSGVECIDIVEHMTFNAGNAVKYIWRADFKHDDPIEDLKKAAWYVAREIQRLSKPAEAPPAPAHPSQGVAPPNSTAG